MDETKVVLTLKEYIKLKKSEKELNLLQCGGVNNWEWYSESLSRGKSYDEHMADVEDGVMEDIESGRTNVI